MDLHRTYLRAVMSQPCYQITMRFVVVVAAIGLAAGCTFPGGLGGPCEIDADCSEGVCARDSICTPASDLREVKVTWTVRGMAASSVTCAGTPDLGIVFTGSPTQQLGYSPVPCAVGQFTIVKLPRSYTQVELGRDGGFGTVKSIDSTNMVAFDLQL